MEQVKISLPSKSEYVVIARLAASALANQCGFDIDDIEDIKVAVGEACNNAVLHTGSGLATYDIHFSLRDDEFVVEIIDSGVGFDLNEYHEPNLDNPSVGGLGIFIMKSLMDDVKLSSSPQSGTAITLIKKIS